MKRKVGPGGGDFALNPNRFTSLAISGGGARPSAGISANTKKIKAGKKAVKTKASNERSERKKLKGLKHLVNETKKKVKKSK